MTKRISSIALFSMICLFASIDVFGQVTPIEIFQQGNNLRVRDRTGTIAIPYEPYLYDMANMMRIELFSGEKIEGFYRYNLETESLENSSAEETLEPGVIKNFRVTKSDGSSTQTFVNIKALWPDSEYLGFFEQVDENFTTVVKHYLQYKPADYNANMNMGNPYDRVEKEIEIYYRVLNKWYLAPQAKKQFIEALSEFKAPEDIKKFIKKNKIKMAIPSDVAKVIDYVANN